MILKLGGGRLALSIIPALIIFSTSFESSARKHGRVRKAHQTIPKSSGKEYRRLRRAPSRGTAVRTRIWIDVIAADDTADHEHAHDLPSAVAIGSCRSRSPGTRFSDQWGNQAACDAERDDHLASASCPCWLCRDSCRANRSRRRRRRRCPGHEPILHVRAWRLRQLIPKSTFNVRHAPMAGGPTAAPSFSQAS